MALPVNQAHREIEGTSVKPEIQYEATFSPHGTSRTEIVYQKDASLYIVDRKNTYQRAIVWSNDPVRDICYSKKLEKFILITPQQCFTLDTKKLDMMIIEEVSHISPVDENCHFQSCACYETVLFLTYSEESYPVEQREINSSCHDTWKVIKHWKTMLKPNDICKCVQFIRPDTIGLIINNLTARTTVFNMLSLRTGQLSNKYDLNFGKKYSRFFRLGADEYIFIPDDRNHLFLAAHKDYMYREFRWPLPPFTGGIQISFSGWWPYSIPE